MQGNQGNVYSFVKGQTEQDIINELRELGGRYSIHEIVPLKTSDICVAQWVRLKCKYGCRKYGTNWCCPPETPSPDETKALLSEYKKALLLCGTSRNGQFYMDNQRKRRVQVNAWKGTVALERRLFLEGYYKAFALVSENCALCKKCSYPDACAFPMDRRPSVESCAIDIFQTLRNIGKAFSLAHDVNEEYNCYSIILLE
jgi:predicted metal-binding protein